MNILVTGATGFIGQRLIQKLGETGHTIHALVRNVNHPYLPKMPNVKPFKGDLLDRASLVQAMEGCNQVYHTAALAKMWVKNRQDFYDINVTGTKMVLETAQQLGVDKLVYTSTCGVWGPTISTPMTENDPRIVGFPIEYEKTKYLAELEVKPFVEQGLNVVIVNPSRVYGEGPVTDSNTVGKMVKAYMAGKWRIIPGDGKAVANYVFLEDVVNGHIAAMEKGKTGERYILGGDDLSFDEFFDVVAKVTGKQYRLFHLPQKLIKYYSYLEWAKTKVTGLPPFFLPEFADRLNYSQKYSSQKAINQLGYQITSFEEGITRTINFFKNNPNA